MPNVAETEAYYEEFGLDRGEDGYFDAQDAQRQLKIVHSPRRRLVEMGMGVDDPDNLSRIHSSLTKLGYDSTLTEGRLTSREPVTGIDMVVTVQPRLQQPRVEATRYNGPGRRDRTGRAPGIVREGPVKPRRLGHCVSGTTDLAATMRFMVDGLGFKVSDHIAGKGAFLRCSEDHHNFLALDAPVEFLHHSSWQVDDIDEVGRGAKRMLEEHPERHVWGLGRHHAGSNFFWYLKDPAGNFSEYFSDMDCIPEDEVWEPEVLEKMLGVYNWGPPLPPSFLHPDDLAELMTGAHSGR